MAATTFATLSNGVKIPRFGLGTWQSKPEEVDTAVTTALDNGYRLIDTAKVYENEQYIGDALEKYFKAGKLKREDVFLTTKLWLTHNRAEDVEDELRLSLKKLKTSYVDLFLIHQPVTYDHKMEKQDHSVKIEDTWKAMEEVYNKGLTRAIGVSNHTEEQIERLLRAAKVPIMNSQVELHLQFRQKKHREFCKKHNITVTAYAPIGSPGRSKEISSADGLQEQPDANAEPLQHPSVLKLADKYKKTGPQILLRHLLQEGILIIPKSVTPARIVENAKIFDFELTADEVAELNNAEQGNRLFMQEHCAGHPEDPFEEEREQSK